MRVVATAGHVDHGKSTLVRVLTGTDPDRWDEEKRRGLTIDLGFAHLTLPNGEEIGFVDVPGHERFVANMLAGVGGVDACVFVVAATEGWKPQSEEHLRILDLVGVRHGVIALTMSDLVDEEWLQLQQLDVRERVAGTFLADAPIVAVSAVTDPTLARLVVELERLVEATPPAADRGRPRLWIDRVFSAKGSGTVVTGTLTGGSVAAGDQLDVVPSGAEVRVRGLQTHGRHLERAVPGSRVALNLSGIERSDVRRGDALVVASQWRPTTLFDATLRVLGGLPHHVSRRGAFTAHIGSGEVPARVRVLESQSIAPGSSGLVRLHLARAVPLVPGDRFVLRESGRGETVGGGEVLDVAPTLPASKALPDASVARVVRERGIVDAAELSALVGADQRPTIDRWVFDPQVLAQLRDDLVARVDAAGPLGLDGAVLAEHERAVLRTVDGLSIEGGRITRAGAPDPLVAHPLLATLRASLLAPPDPAGVSRAELREMVRRGLVVERDGVVFHPEAVPAAAAVAAELLAQEPAGFTMATFRDALGVTRKHALPLAAELDGRGITHRRGDVRVAGPHLPSRP